MMLASALPAAAQTDLAPLDPLPVDGLAPIEPRPGLRLPTRLSLEPVRPSELFATTLNAVDEGTWTAAGASWRPPRLFLVREIPDLFVFVPWPDADPNAIRVDVEVLGPDGTPGVLGSTIDADSRIHVRTRPWRERWVDDGRGRRLRGGLRLELDLNEATVGGAYRGTLEVRVEQL